MTSRTIEERPGVKGVNGYSPNSLALDTTTSKGHTGRDRRTGDGTVGPNPTPPGKRRRRPWEWLGRTEERGNVRDIYKIRNRYHTLLKKQGRDLF